MALFRRFLNVFRPTRLDREFDEELEFHRRMSLRRARQHGLSEAEAEPKKRKDGSRDWFSASIRKKVTESRCEFARRLALFIVARYANISEAYLRRLCQRYEAPSGARIA